MGLGIPEQFVGRIQDARVGRQLFKIVCVCQVVEETVLGRLNAAQDTFRHGGPQSKMSLTFFFFFVSVDPAVCADAKWAIAF